MVFRFLSRRFAATQKPSLDGESEYVRRIAGVGDELAVPQMGDTPHLLALGGAGEHGNNVASVAYRTGLLCRSAQTGGAPTAGGVSQKNCRAVGELTIRPTARSAVEGLERVVISNTLRTFYGEW